MAEQDISALLCIKSIIFYFSPMLSVGSFTLERGTDSGDDIVYTLDFYKVAIKIRILKESCLKPSILAHFSNIVIGKKPF